MPIYRAVYLDKANTDTLKLYYGTSRPPSNIPYIVDDPGDWARADHLPRRRRAVFASPATDVALAACADGSRAYAVERADAAPIAQLIGFEDSKYHPECRRLPKWLFQ